MVIRGATIIAVAGLISGASGFLPTSSIIISRPTNGIQKCRSAATIVTLASPDGWNGEVASNTKGGKISGCTMQQVGTSETDWIMTIDGTDADLGRFSEAIYKKIIQDAKRQQFQGFRAGTIPPHLESTYRTFAMDECARETVLEAMQQNNVRPFENARTLLQLENFCIPPPPTKKKQSKKIKKAPAADDAPVEEKAPEWSTFETMKEAINAGWKPGQSFSFVAKNAKGQKVKDQKTEGATPLGIDY
jgi:hypothetical protein